MTTPVSHKYFFSSKNRTSHSPLQLKEENCLEMIGTIITYAATNNSFIVRALNVTNYLYAVLRCGKSNGRKGGQTERLRTYTSFVMIVFSRKINDGTNDAWTWMDQAKIYKGSQHK